MAAMISCSPPERPVSGVVYHLFICLPEPIMPALLRLFHWLFPLLMLAATLPASALDPNDLLPPEKAFAARLEQQGKQLLVHVDIAPGYYLYRDRTRIGSEPAGVLGTPQLPPGEAKQDPYFGLQQVYHQRVTFSVPITAASLPANFTLLATIQGCADAGLCYPPYTHKLKPGEGRLVDWLSPATSTDEATPALSRQQWLGTLLTFLLAGIGMAFTACMYPLLPIVSSMVAGQGQRLNKMRGFVLTMAYVQGLALTYTAVGVMAGKTGSLLTVWLQQPAVILAASALMVVFALGMFDLITIQLPSALQSLLATQSNKLGGGRLASVFAMGALSADGPGPAAAAGGHLWRPHPAARRRLDAAGEIRLRRGDAGCRHLDGRPLPAGMADHAAVGGAGAGQRVVAAAEPAAAKPGRRCTLAVACHRYGTGSGRLVADRRCRHGRAIAATAAGRYLARPAGGQTGISAHRQ